MITQITVQHPSINGGSETALDIAQYPKHLPDKTKRYGAAVKNIPNFGIDYKRWIDGPFKDGVWFLGTLEEGQLRAFRILSEYMIQMLCGNERNQPAYLRFYNTCRRTGESKVYPFKFFAADFSQRTGCLWNIDKFQFDDCYNNTLENWETLINFHDLETVVVDVREPDAVIQEVVCTYTDTNQSFINDGRVIAESGAAYVSQIGLCADGDGVFYPVINEDYAIAAGLTLGVDYLVNITPNGSVIEFTLASRYESFFVAEHLDAINWCIKETNVSYNSFDIVDPGQGIPEQIIYSGLQAQTTWWREARTIPAGDPTPDGWQTVEVIGGQKLIWRCPLTAGGELVNNFDNGRRLIDVIAFVATETSDCITCFKSYFFGTDNVDYNSQAFGNDYYNYALQKLQNLSLHTISDVIRPEAQESAGPIFYEITLQDLLEDLETLFNIRWLIDESGCLIIEHASFFFDEDAATVIDSRPFWEVKEYIKPRVIKKHGMEVAEDYKVRREKWKTVEDTPQEDFKGVDIIYNNLAERDNTYSLNVIATDVQFLAAKDEGDLTEDKQFVLIAADVNDIIFAGNGLLTGAGRLNQPLSISQLHENLHKFRRIDWFFNMNNQDTVADTVIPVWTSNNLEMCTDDCIFDGNALYKIHSNYDPHMGVCVSLAQVQRYREDWFWEDVEQIEFRQYISINN